MAEVYYSECGKYVYHLEPVQIQKVCALTDTVMEERYVDFEQVDRELEDMGASI